MGAGTVTFPIKCYKSAGSLRFGMTSDQVRECLDGNYTSFKRTPDSALPCDYFKSLGVFVYYKEPGVVEAIEFSSPANPVYQNRNLLEMAFSDLLKMLLKEDSELEIEPDALTSYALGIGVYSPYADECPSLPAESIIVFERDYYG